VISPLSLVTLRQDLGGAAGANADIDSWARRFARAGGASVDPVVPAGFEWRQSGGPRR
jgi:hypothetical protein